MTGDELINTLRKIILRIELRVAEMDYTRDDAARILTGEIQSLLDQFGVTVEEVVPELIAVEYFGGMDEATAALASAGAIPASSAAYALTEAGTIRKPFKKAHHVDAIGIMLEDTLMDFQAALRTAAMTSNDAIETALAEVREDLARGLIDGSNRKKITAKVAKSFQKNGLVGFITRDNRRLPLDFYSMTVTRTKLRTASVAGHTARYEEAGMDLVMINENADTCAICARYRGMVVSLTGKTKGFPVAHTEIPLPPYHPNCRGSIIPVVWSRLSAAERDRIRRHNDAFDPEEDRRTPTQRARYEKEQERRRIANQEKKLYARWVSMLGDEAPANIGAFRRMKRQNTKRFQELSTEYLRRTRQVNT